VRRWGVLQLAHARFRGPVGRCQTFDVVVIGAGIHGAAAAWTDVAPAAAHGADRPGRFRRGHLGQQPEGVARRTALPAARQLPAHARIHSRPRSFLATWRRTWCARRPFLHAHDGPRPARARRAAGGADGQRLDRRDRNWGRARGALPAAGPAAELGRTRGRCFRASSGRGVTGAARVV
jgi:hypothetical protein